MPDDPHTPPPRIAPAASVAWAPAATWALLLIGGAAAGWGLLGPGGALDADAPLAGLSFLAGGVIALAGAAAWSLRRGAANELVGRAVADHADGQTPPELLRITRTRGGFADDWNRLLDRLAAGERDHPEPAGGAEADPGAGLRPAFNAVPHGLLVLRHDGVVEDANGAAARLLAPGPDGLVGRPLAEVVTDAALADRVLPVAAGLDRRGGSVEVPAGDAGASVLRATVRPLRGGRARPGGRQERSGALLLLEDVTQQRCADRARDLFVAQASHELRAPLMNIQLHAERAIDLGTTPGAEAAAERAECLNHVNDETLRLSRLIEEVLSVSQIKAGSLGAARDDVAWGLLLERVVKGHAAAAAERGQTLTLDADPTLPVLQGDREKLSMLLHNLVGNAVKYGRRGGCTLVDAGVVEGFLRVRVTDDGPGVLEDERERVFDPFVRGTHDAGGEPAPEGTGLGLSLAAEVAALHEGSLRVEPGEGGVGARFVLRIPVRSGSSVTRDAEPAGVIAAERPTPERKAA